MLLFQVEQPRLLGVDSDEDASKLSPGRGSNVSTESRGRAGLTGQSLAPLGAAFLSKIET